MGSALAAFVTTTAGMSWLLSCSIKAALLLAASWLGAALLQRGTAAARHQIWTLGVVGALLLPLLCWALPSVSLSSAPQIIASTSSLDAPAVLVTAGPATGAAPAWPAWLAIVWAVGALVVALRVLRGHLAARRLAHTAEPSVAASWSAALREAAASLALAKRIQLLRSGTIGSPMTIGVLRPRVVLPAAADAWSPERLRAVLVHELGHVRRHDTAIQLAAQLGCALYWWNPLAWLAAARLRIEREHACDDLVIGAGILPSSYAADLLEVARSVSMDAHAHAGAICMVDLSWTEARLRRILDATAPRRPLRARFRLAVHGLTLACAVTLACTSSPPVLPPSPTEVASTAALGDEPAPAPAALGTLSVGAPFVRDWDMLRLPASQGALDLSLVATEVKRGLGDLEQCYERRLAVRPALSGTVVIHWVIAETGKVTDACITQDTVGDDEVTACVNKLVQEGHFPAPRGGSVDVSFPFVFTARPAVFGMLSQAGDPAMRSSR
jgi:beta-lactamase regulating signal transducer with metallopeptidase domain